jgi:hypothetical protein
MTRRSPRINASQGNQRNQLNTTEVSEACHIRVRDDLSMFKTRSERSHVDTFERRLECIDDKSICSITNSMDILERVRDYLGNVKDGVPLTVCQPSRRNFSILVVKTS